MPSEIFQISLERLKQQLYRQSEERNIRLGTFSDYRIHDWIQKLDEAYAESSLEEQLHVFWNPYKTQTSFLFSKEKVLPDKVNKKLVY